MASQENKVNPHRLQAEEYLRKHHIMELFEDLCTAIAYKKPESVEDFLVEQLELRKKSGTSLSSPQAFTSQYSTLRRSRASSTCST